MSLVSTKMVNPAKDTFMYFAYGSNLLKKRIHLNNPSAEFVGPGRLDDHQLDFLGYSDNWGGCSATIVPKKDIYVWGAVWRVHNEHLPTLDRQEGVETKWYFPKTVDIVMLDGSKVQCRTYQQSNNPQARKDHEDIPLERRPSITYLDVIIKGALECKLPTEYIDKLKKIPHNSKYASPEMLEKLKVVN